jgi:Tol biopolymer transport system component
MSRITRVVLICVSLFLVGLLGAASLQARPRAQLPHPPREGELPHLQQFPTDTDREVANLSATSITANYGSWSKITFQSYRDGNWEIYIANGDGTGQMRLTANSASDTYPRLNRGGTRIVFDSNRTGAYQIYTMNPDGSGLSQLTTSAGNNFDPVWSPDGSQIAFESFRDGQAEVYVMNANGTGLIRLTNHPAFDGHPVWSPDGSKIAFTSDRGTPANTGNRVWVMNADGSSPQQLTTQYYCQGPNWSPDGARIAFDADATNDGSQEIWLMNANGSGQTQVYDPPNESPQGYPGLTDAWIRGWSPDGSFVTYTRLTWIYYQGAWYWYTGYLEALDLTTSNGFRLVSTQGDDWYPDWQTLDTSAPYSAVQSVPEYSRSGGTNIKWSGQDVGLAGIKNYDIQYRLGSGGTWMDWLTTASTSSLYTGTPGTTVFFRSRARDNANNLEAWPTMVSGDASTTLYTWQLAGHVTDNRGVSLPQVAIPLTPTSVNTINTDLQGRYSGYLSASGAHVLAANHLGYASVQSTFDASADQLLSFYLPPQDDVIQNGSFEAEAQQLVGWTASGSITPMIITTSHQLGTQAASLAFTCPAPYPCLGDPETVSADSGGSSSYPDLVVDITGTVHLVRNQGQKVYYWYRLPQGSWIGPQLIADNTGYSYLSAPRLAVDTQGGLHVVWNGPAGLYYSEKPPSGNWTVPTVLTSSGQAPAIAVDSHDGLHIVYQGDQTYYLERLPSGVWITPIAVAGAYGWSGIAVGPDDTVHFIWQQISDGVYYRARLSNGVWTTPQKLFSGFGYSYDPLLIAVDGMGQVYTFWTWAYDGYFAMRNLQGVWSAPQSVPKSRGWGDMAVDQRGLVHLLSTSGLVNEEGVYYRQRSVEGQWAAPVKLSDHYNYYAFAITVDRADMMHMIWETTYQSTRRSVEASSASINQSVTISPDMYHPTLAAMYQLNAAPAMFGQALAIDVTDEITTTRLASFAHNSRWTPLWLDLQPWAGHTITLTLTLLQTANNGYPTLLLDDVTLGEWRTPVPLTISPNHLEAWSTTVVTITGDNFIATPQVRLGNLPVIDVQWIDSRTLTITTPALPPGFYDLLVTNPDNQANGVAYALVVGKQTFLPIITK